MKFNLILAVCEKLGIGKNGTLPWKLKKELKYFNRITNKVSNSNKRNAIIMGKRTYFSIPESKRPLPGRLNIVLTTNPEIENYSENIVICNSFTKALELLNTNDYNDIENIWIIGGNSVYNETLKHENCHRIYLTEIKAIFECDVFFSGIPKNFKQIPNDPDIPSEDQEENGICYQYKVFERITTDN